MEDNRQRPGQVPGNDKNPRKGPKFNIYWIYGIIILMLIGLQFFTPGMSSDVKDISFQDFRRDYLEKGNVEKLVVVNKSEVEVFTKNAPPPEDSNVPFSKTEKTPA